MRTLQHVNPSGTRVFFGTLTGGESLHEAFTEIVQTKWIKAATIEMLGGLSEVEFTEYDFVNVIGFHLKVFRRSVPPESEVNGVTLDGEEQDKSEDGFHKISLQTSWMQVSHPPQRRHRCCQCLRSAACR